MQLKVAVIDDEAPIREWLVYCISGASPDYAVCTAANGSEACELLLSQRPDIVFTDICMPNMDGLELIRRMRTELPFTRFVILTNYADFSYAKQALSLGAAEYILKSEMRSTDILKILDETMERAKHCRSIKVNDFFPSGHFDLYEIYNVAQHRDAPEKYLEEKGVSPRLPMQLYCVENRNSPQGWLELTRIADACCAQTGAQILVACEKQYEYFVVQAEKLDEAGQALLSLLRGKRHVGISTEAENASAFMRLLSESAVAQRAGFFFPLQERILYSELCSYPPLDREEILTGCRECMDLIAANRLTEMEGFLARWFDMLARPHAGDISWAIERCHRMVIFIEEHYEREFSATGRQSSELPDTLAKCRDQANQLLMQIRQAYQTQYSAVIRDALLYIHQHYTEELPLARVAQALYRSPEYFSRQFKAEVGENFSVYLTLYRLERAQELLRRTDLSVGEIACRVGYTTPGYFGRLYKKYLGITPEQERMSK